MKRRFGQHFLAWPEAAARIAEAAGILPGEEVIEIGPGRGALTNVLLDRGARVTAVEIDARLCARLAAAIESPSLRIVRADFLELGASDLPPSPKFVGNLPFAAATAMLRRVLDCPGWRGAVLMFQREVAARILARPGSSRYGLLTVATALRAEAESVLIVPRGSFRPPPRVDAEVLRFRPRLAGLVEGGPEEATLLAAASAAFRHRRKTAANSLRLSLGLTRSEAEAALARAGLPPAARAEDIPIEGFLALSRALRDAADSR